MELVSINAGGRTGGGASENPSISDNGRFVTFQSEATDLITDPEPLAAGVVDDNGEPDVYLRDMLLKTTALVSINSAGTASGGAGNDTLSCGDGNDTINGGLGNDIIAGGMGDETLFDGPGDGLLDVGVGLDVCVVTRREATTFWWTAARSIRSISRTTIK